MVDNIESLSRLSSHVQTDSVVDGPGLRTVVWFQGCLYACKGCHNQETWSIDGGSVYKTSAIIEEIRNSDNPGVTLSGGDPLFQIDRAIEIAKASKEMGKDVWVYSGNVFENLVKREKVLELFNYVDVLVDGPFVLEKKNLNMLYRGSENQRLIDVKKSLKNKKVEEVSI